MSKISEKDIERAILIIDKFKEELGMEADRELKMAKSYIQSFGPAIINNGLLPAIAFYEKNETQSEGTRYYTMRMVYYMLCPKNEKDEIKFKNEKDYKPLLMNHVLEKMESIIKLNDINIKKAEKEIIKAVIALKTVIRLYVPSNMEVEDNGN